MTTADTLAAALDSPSAHRLTLKPKVGWQPVDLQELWRYRELLWILALRDIRVRYKQTALGVAWAVIQPFFTMLVFTIVSSLGSLSSDGLPKPLFLFCGLLPWLLFSNGLSGAGNSLIGNQNLITKVYFPRLVIPLATIVTGLVDFAISLGMLLLLMAWYHVVPGPQILLLPVFIVLSVTAALGAGLWLSALNVQFRDVRYALPLLINLLQFCTPILYPADQFKRHWVRLLIGINPISGIVEGFRWCMIGGPHPGPLLVVSILSITVVLTGGLFYFRRMEKSFADVV